MNTQTEEIVWHKYPEEKPDEIGFYQIQLGYDSPINLFDFDIWDGFRFVESHNHANAVFAWAEMPRGWKDG